MAAGKRSKKVVAIVVYPQISMLELTSTYSALNGLKMEKYDVHIVAENLEPLPSDTPLKVVPHKSLAELPAPTILAVLGGGLPAMNVLGNPVVLDYVRQSAQTSKIVLGIGGGSVVLAACGLLKDRPSAGHWAYAGLLNALGARYQRKHWVFDGKFVTSTGGTGGMDVGLSLLAKLSNEQNARILQLFAEYEPQPPFGAIHWSNMDNTSIPFTELELAPLRLAVANQPELLEAVTHWSRERVVADYA